MRVLQIGLSSVKGGIESCILDHARALREKDVVFDYVDIYGDGIACADEISQLGGAIYTLPNYKRHYSESKKKLKQIITDNGYKYIHVNMLSAASLMSIQVAKELGIVPIVHSHNAGTVGLVRLLLHSVNFKRMSKMNMIRLACSEKAGRWMFGNKEFQIIPNGIQTDKYAFSQESREKIRKSLNISDDEQVLGFVGRIEQQKNPLYLIKVLLSLKKLRSNVKLIVVGDGLLRKDMMELAEQNGLTNDIYFAGMQKDASTWYSAFDAFLLTSLYEGLPIASIEAQASGLPCFISDTVTKEVDLTDNVYYCELTDGADNWASEIHVHLHDNGERIKYADVITASDYSIVKASLKLKQIYDGMNGEL